METIVSILSRFVSADVARHIMIPLLIDADEAVRSNDVYAQKLLIDKENINPRWIICASENGDLDTIKYLVSLNADIRANDDLAVCSAYENEHLDTVRYLMSLGAPAPNQES